MDGRCKMRVPAYLYVILAAFLWGIIGLFYKRLSAAGFTPMQIVAIRVSVAAVCLILWLAVTAPDKLKIHLKDCWCFVGTGVCSMVFFNWCYFNAIEKSSLGVAAVLLYTAPAFVMLLSIPLFRERLTLRKVMVLALTVLGCALVSGVGPGQVESLTPAGLLYGLGSGLGYALYGVIGTFGLRRYSPETVTAYTFVFASVAAVPLAGFQAEDFLAMRQWPVLGSALSIGIVCSMLPFVVYTKGLLRIAPSKASILASLEPAVAAAVGILVFHESASLPKVLGMLIILGAVLFLNWPQRHTAQLDPGEMR